VDPLQGLIGNAVKAFIAGKFDDACALYEQILAQHPDHPGALKGLAMTNAQAGRFDEAVRWATKLTEAAPEDAMSWTTLSMLLQKAGKIKEAEDAQAKARVLGWKAQLKKP
jgi:Flp pilus assembly protein TadD